MAKLLSRSEYYEQRKQGDPDNCLLCDTEQVVLKDFKHWNWVAAIAPYWKYHTMLVPKRHIAKINELTKQELEEFLKLQEAIVGIYKESDLKGDDGTPYQNVLLFWRDRFDMFNSILGVNNLEHLHIHFTCDREHFLDPISEESAATWDVGIFKNRL